MTAQTYINYEMILMQQQFTPTGRVITQPPNWTRRTFSADPIARVFLSSDGSFKAYNKEELILCHGSSVEELQGCFD